MCWCWCLRMRLLRVWDVIARTLFILVFKKLIQTPWITWTSTFYELNQWIGVRMDMQNLTKYHCILWILLINHDVINIWELIIYWCPLESIHAAKCECRTPSTCLTPHGYIVICTKILLIAIGSIKPFSPPNFNGLTFNIEFRLSNVIIIK